MQILVVVANNQERTLLTEVEKGSMSTSVVHGLVRPEPKDKLPVSQGLPLAACLSTRRGGAVAWGAEASHRCGGSMSISERRQRGRQAASTVSQWPSGGRWGAVRRPSTDLPFAHTHTERDGRPHHRRRATALSARSLRV